MFGQIKENIFRELEAVRNDHVQLKSKFAEFSSALKRSKDLKEFYEIYDLVETAQFDSEAIAKEFIEECVVALNKLNKDEINTLKALAGSGNATTISKKAAGLDRLVFENLSIRDRIVQKASLIKTLTQTTDKKPQDYKELLNNLDKKVSEKMTTLTTEQKKALDLFVESDEHKLKIYFRNLVESTITVLEEKILVMEDVDTSKALLQSKKKLQRYKGEKPTIQIVDEILDLKSFLANA